MAGWRSFHAHALKLAARKKKMKKMKIRKTKDGEGERGGEGKNIHMGEELVVSKPISTTWVSPTQASFGIGEKLDMDDELVVPEPISQIRVSTRENLGIGQNLDIGGKPEESLKTGNELVSGNKSNSNPVPQIRVSMQKSASQIRVQSEDNLPLDASNGVTRKFYVPVARSEEIERTRRNLPIVMMEQEIMEAINEHPVIVISGETGCGKTTQVPQFLYEAGFGSTACPERSGLIGITQPRRVAVLAMAKRVAHELGLNLGKEVGFQVRHDRKVGDKCFMKFMTDGILLREIQSDFLLRKYSVIVLDEAHERGLNTDILMGMLSRIVKLRLDIYEDHNKRSRSENLDDRAGVTPLKLIIMSATLRVNDFISNKTMFANPPPLINIPARQYPVTIHFSARTELLDYVGKAYKKVCNIHRKLPPGGILVFLTGQNEISFLCRKLKKAFAQKNHREKSAASMDTSFDLKKCDTRDMGYFDDANVWVEGEEEEEEDGELSDSLVESDSEMDNESELSETTDESDEGERLPLEAIKSAFDGLSGKAHDSDTLENESPDNHGAEVGGGDLGPLHVLPLYAMLSADAQLRVFNPVPEGSRLVVVATNVAETSITIPGIRYVVDCGRAKQKNYERSCGITRYDIQWISKASAAQRAGRAGRTGPGHCYRLYSSAVFNDTFPDFSIPEIDRVPIEGLVLLLKHMGIKKVINFPFPSKPEGQALSKAERCLEALSALDPRSGLLTPLGKAMGIYPIGPRHSRMLLSIMQDVRGDLKSSASRLLLAYAAGLAASLSLDAPFLRDPSTNSEEKAESQGEKQRKDSRAQNKYRNQSSDALSIVAALRAYTASRNGAEFCKANSLHAKGMQEMLKLQRQLLQLLFLYEEKEGVFSRNRTSSKMEVMEVEEVWKDESHKLSPEEEALLRRAMCAGWADRVARKLSLEESIKMIDPDGDDGFRRRAGVRYRTCDMEEPTFLHPSSSLHRTAPEFVVYGELLYTSRPYLKCVTAVEPEWLVSHAGALCSFSKPLKDPPPWYDPLLDEVMCWVSPSFGPRSWKLPLQARPMLSSSSEVNRTAIFACALLEGKVLPSLRDLHPLAADPTSVLKPEGLVQRRVANLLDALSGASVVDSRRALHAAWETRPLFLYAELLSWIRKDHRTELPEVWNRMKQEISMDACDLPKVKKKKHCKHFL